MHAIDWPNTLGSPHKPRIRSNKSVLVSGNKANLKLSCVKKKNRAIKRSIIDVKERADIIFFHPKDVSKTEIPAAAIVVKTRFDVETTDLPK